MALHLFAAPKLRSIDHSARSWLHRSFFQKQKGNSLKLSNCAQVSIVPVYVPLLHITEPRPLQMGKSTGHAWSQNDACNEMIG